MINNKILKAINNNIFETIKKHSDELNIECYVIGGYVRDLLLNKSAPKDIDVLVIGNGIEMAKQIPSFISIQKKKLKFLKISERQCLNSIILKLNSYCLKALIIGGPIVKLGTLEDDLNRRDFTINAIGVGLNSKNWGKLIDNFNGIEDLKNGLIKTPLDPLKTFSDDPLRMMRAIRFATQLNFSISRLERSI